MNFVSVRIITDDVPGLVAFYEQATGLSARWATPVFAEIVTPSGTLAIAGTPTVALFAGAARPADNHTAILEFRVDDVDEEFARLTGESAAGELADLVQPPTTMPWGNRSLLLRDPDGNLVNLFTPVTPEALARIGR